MTTNILADTFVLEYGTGTRVIRVFYGPGCHGGKCPGGVPGTQGACTREGFNGQVILHDKHIITDGRFANSSYGNRTGLRIDLSEGCFKSQGDVALSCWQGNFSELSPQFGVNDTWSTQIPAVDTMVAQARAILGMEA